jgi:hypothetical protein
MNLDNGCSYKLRDIIFIIGCHPYSSTLRIDGKREPLRRDERPLVVDLCRLGLEDSKQVGRVDKDDSYKDDNLGDKGTFGDGWKTSHTKGRKSLFFL